jgi:hypothetical protein
MNVAKIRQPAAEHFKGGITAFLELSFIHGKTRVPRSIRTSKEEAYSYRSASTGSSRCCPLQGLSMLLVESRHRISDGDHGLPRRPDSHFPTAVRLLLRLHFKWRDNPGYGYILEWLDGHLLT